MFAQSTHLVMTQSEGEWDMSGTLGGGNVLLHHEVIKLIKSTSGIGHALPTTDHAPAAFSRVYAHRLARTSR